MQGGEYCPQETMMIGDLQEREVLLQSWREDVLTRCLRQRVRCDRR